MLDLVRLRLVVKPVYVVPNSFIRDLILFTSKFTNTYFLDIC